MKPRSQRPIDRNQNLRPHLLAWSVAACFVSVPVWALPTGAQIAAGSASINQVGNTLTVANTPGAIINWNAFSIGALEAVRFDQQNSLSSVLNRVTGGSASSILGSLSSNGRVFLINPNGILFGAGSRIDVNGLIASTLNLSDQDFLAGRLNFQAGETAGSIRNAGALQASPGGNIYLIAPDIENSGIVRAPNGEVVLAAGRQISLVDGGHPDIQVVVSAPTDKAVNLGDIAAGKVGVFGALLSQRGRVSADTVETDAAGRIVFRASQQLDVEAGSQTTANGDTGGTVVLQSAGDAYVRGTVEATGVTGTGGTIAALGNRVAVLDQAVLDASGAAGGGRVMVGGDYQGRNPDIQNAQVAYFGPEATLKADAGKVGAGGTVIVWADDTTRAYGRISARGGSQGGNGGFVETSGKHYLDFGAKVDTRAPDGSNGTLLLDPNDIVIAGGTGDGASDGTGTFQGSQTSTVGQILDSSGDAGPTTVYESELEGLSAGTNIILNAYNSVTTSGSFTGGIALPSDSNLSIYTTYADGAGITLGTPITASGTGTISISAGNGVVGSTTPAPLNVNSLTTANGQIDLWAGGTVNINGTLNAGTASLNVYGGDIVTLATTTGQIATSGLAILYSPKQIAMNGGSSIAASNLTLAADNMTLSGSISAPQVTVKPYTSAKTIDLGGSDSAGVLGITNVELQTIAATYLTFGDPATSVLNVTGAITIPGSTSNTTLRAGGNISIGAGIAGGSGNLTVYGGGAVSNTASGPITIGGLEVIAQGGSVSLTGNNEVQTLAGSTTGSFSFENHRTGGFSIGSVGGSSGLTAATGVTVSGYGGNINVANNVTVSSGTVTIGQEDTVSTGNIDIAATKTVSGTAVDIHTVGSGKAITVNGVVQAGGGGVSLSAPGGITISDSVTFGNAGGSTNTLTGNVTIASGHSLSGIGNVTVNGNLTNNGTLQVGNGDGNYYDLTVNGNFVQGSTGTLNIYASSPSPSFVGDKLTATGSATLSGTLSFSGGSSGAYPIIAAGSISGNFTSISGGYVFNSATGELTVPVTLTWDGGGSDGLWLTALNWDGDTVPTAANDVDLAGAAVTLGGAGAANNLSCSGNCSLTVDGALTLQGNGTLYDLVLGATGSIAGSGAHALTVSNGFTQNAAAAITNFNRVVISTAGSLSVGNISTVVPGGGYVSGSADGVIRLTSAGGTISQIAGTTLGGAAIRASSYGNITLEEANPTGIIAANITMGGDIRFKSTSAIKVDNVDGLSGINNASGLVKLQSTYAGTAFTQSAPIVAGSGLLLAGTGSSQSVSLLNAANSFAQLAANLSSASTVEIAQGVSSALTVGTVDSTSGITATGATKLKLANANGAGALTISQPISVGSTADFELIAGSGGISIGQPLTGKSIALFADGTISPSAALTASDWVQFANKTAGGSFLIDSGNCTGACIDIADFAQINSSGGTVFGDNDTHPTGNLTVNAAINTSTFAATPTFVALLGGSGASDSINIAAPITLASGRFVFNGYSVSNSSSGTDITAATVSGKANSATLYFAGTNTGISSFTPPAGAAQTFGGVLTIGAMSLTHAAGYGFTNGGGTMTASSLTLSANFLGAAATPLATQTPTLTFTATNGDAYITNNAAVPGPVNVTGDASAGQIGFINYGATTVTTHVNALGSIALTANSPLTIGSGASVTSSNGSISLTAGSGGAMTIDGGVSATNGTVSAAAGSMSGGGTITDSVNVSPISPVTFAATSAFTNNTPPPSGGTTTTTPTLDACIADPTAAGCSTILPTLDACVVDPTAAGCSVVLPTLDACLATPTAPGCSAVLPTLDACVATPTAPGCSAVLPPLATCTATPSIPGCSAVLPSVSACVSNPTAAGCSAVLPTLTACTAAPSTPGCSAVLPTIGACVSNPTAAGCSAVLPTVSACVANPSAPGCTVVLPALATCTVAPATPGCAAVLPTLDACVANPAAAGCAAVLPPLAICVSAPSTPGCSVVLPPTDLPTDQQLACLADPANCTDGATPGSTAQNLIGQVQSSEQQLVLNSQTGQGESGRPDLTLLQNSGGGGGGSGSNSGNSSSSGEGEGDGEGDQTGQTPQGNNQQGDNNAPQQRQYCN